MIITENYEKEIDCYLNTVKNEFSPKDVLQYINKNYNKNFKINEDNLDEIGLYLEQFDEVVLSNFTKIDNPFLFITRKALFEGSKFLIKPLEEEINNGYLFIGHRFLPFCNFNSKLNKIKLFDRTLDKPIRTKMIKKSISDILIYYSIFGKQRLFEHLSADKDNLKQFTDMEFSPENSLLNIPVYNINNFFKENSFKYGDYILVTVNDYNKSICSAEYFSSDKLFSRVGDVTNSILELDNIFQKIIEEYTGDYEFLDMELQLSLAFYLSDKSLLHDPVIHIGGYLNFSKKFTLQGNDEKTLIWSEDIKFPEIDEDFNLRDEMMQSEEDFISYENYVPIGTETIDELMKIMGFDLCEYEMISYIRDELYMNGSLDSLKRRCFDGRIESLYSDLKPILDKRLIQFWNKETKKYNRKTDEKVASLRSVLLELKDKNIEGQRHIDSIITDPEEVPYEEIHQLAKIIIPLLSSLMLLNTPSKVKAQEMKEMEAHLKHMVPMLENMIHETYMM